MWERAPSDEVAARMLEAVFGADEQLGRPRRSFELTSFQEAAVARTRRVLARRGGVLLADAVGLGKTYVALAVAEDRLRAGGDVIVAVPAALRPVWSSPLRRIPGAGTSCRLVSHTQLSRGWAAAPAAGPRLIIVDEAHRFRNPKTLRYRALARLAAGDAGAPRPELVLVTATPINNSLYDLYHLVRLFLSDAGLRDAGIPSLQALFEGGRPDPAGLQTLVRELVVRRSRAMVRRRFDEDRTPPHTDTGALLEGAGIRFPARAEPRIHRYQDPAVPGRLRAIEALGLAVYDAGSAPLVRLGLLKRMDSSPASFAVSLRRLRGFLEGSIEAAAAGRLLRPGDQRVTGDGDPLQRVLVGVVAERAPPDLDLADLAASARADVGIVEGLLAGLSGPAQPKTEALVTLLDSLAGDRVLVFTEFRDTAEWLWRALVRRGRTARIDGSGAWLGRQPAGRRAVVERFAPVANQRPAPPERERVDVLIATDVLAEGLNLQDARHVVSYDLPWNPVRLLQRIGRVDRLGSPHASVVPHLFVPAQGLDQVLGLTRRLRTKLHGISTALGEDQADTLLEALAGGRVDRIGAVVRGAETARGQSPWEWLRTLWIKGGELDPTSEAARQDSDSHDRAQQRTVPRWSPTADAPPLWAEVGADSLAGTVHSDDPAAPIDGVVLVAISEADTDLDPGLRLLEITAGKHVEPLGRAGALLLAAAFDRGLPHADAGTPSLDGLEGPRARGDAATRLASVHSAVDRYAATLNARLQAPVPVPTRSTSGRLARRILRLLADTGCGLAPDDIARAERVLAKLARPLTPPVDRALSRLLDSHGPERRGDRPDAAPTEGAALVSAALRILESRPVDEAAPGPTRISVRAVLLAPHNPVDDV